MGGELGVSVTYGGQVVLRVTSVEDEDTTSVLLTAAAARQLALTLLDAAGRGEAVEYLGDQVDAIMSPNGEQ